MRATDRILTTQRCSKCVLNASTATSPKEDTHPRDLLMFQDSTKNIKVCSRALRARLNLSRNIHAMAFNKKAHHALVSRFRLAQLHNETSARLWAKHCRRNELPLPGFWRRLNCTLADCTLLLETSPILAVQSAHSPLRHTYLVRRSPEALQSRERITQHPPLPLLLHNPNMHHTYPRSQKKKKNDEMSRGVRMLSHPLPSPHSQQTTTWRKHSTHRSGASLSLSVTTPTQTNPLTPALQSPAVVWTTNPSIGRNTFLKPPVQHRECTQTRTRRRPSTPSAPA